MDQTQYSTIDFLKAMAEFCHGIFLTTMLEDPKHRNSLVKYIAVNRNFFNSIGSDKTSTKIYFFTDEGKKQFGRFSKVAPSNPSAIIDYALLNATMYQFGELQKYSLKENPYVDFENKRYVLFSERNGLMIKKFDLVITTPKRKKLITNISPDLVFVPKALTYFKL